MLPKSLDHMYICLYLTLERLQRHNPSCFVHSSIQVSPLAQEINTSVPKNLLCCFCTVPRYGYRKWCQCVPVWDKSDIPTKSFPSINKQNLPTMSVHTSARGVPSNLQLACVITVCRYIKRKNAVYTIMLYILHVCLLYLGKRIGDYMLIKPYIRAIIKNVFVFFYYRLQMWCSSVFWFSISQPYLRYPSSHMNFRIKPIL